MTNVVTIPNVLKSLLAVLYSLFTGMYRIVSMVRMDSSNPTAPTHTRACAHYNTISFSRPVKVFEIRFVILATPLSMLLPADLSENF